MTLARHTPTRRPGLTLTEALVAMFVAAIGLIALMTLFPLGALQMAQAIKDERCQQTALQADGLMRAYWRSEVVDKRGGGQPGFDINCPDPFILAFDNPNYNVLTRMTPGPMSVPEYTNIYPGIYQRHSATYPDRGSVPLPIGSPSLPVVIDPLGWQAREGLLPPKQYDQPWGGGRQDLTPATPTQPLPLPRRSLRALHGAGNDAWAAVADPQNNANRRLDNSLFGPSLRFSTLMDDLTYDETGSGAPSADLNPVAVPLPTQTGNAGKVERQGRFNWLAVLQRPNADRPDEVNIQIAVFDGRAPGFAPVGQELVYPRDNGVTLVTGLPQLVVFAPGSTAVRVYYAGERPPISKGKWVLDGTIGGFVVRDPAVNLPGPPTSPPAFDPDNTSVNWAAVAGQPLSLRHANFYRVASVTEGIDTARSNATYLDLDLDTPIKARSDGKSVAEPTDWLYYSGSLYVLPGLAEVFDRPRLTK
jgi:hypothetical protein